MTDIEFRVSGIGKLLSEGKLHVAVHQRDYYWPPEKVVDLYEDFDNAIREGQSHFLGTIVLRKADEGFEVVDGQQRMATTTVMLAAIRDIFFGRGDRTMVESVESDFLFRFDRKTEGIQPKLQLNTKDNEYFVNGILTNPDKPERKSAKLGPGKSNEKLQEAAECLRTRINEALSATPEATRKDHLKRWLDFIEQEASVVVLIVPNEEDAYMLFETLNDRGIRVSEADLLKNYLFRLSGKEKLDEVVAKWNETTTLIEGLGPKEDLIDYLRILSSMFYGLTKERKVFKQIKGNNSAQISVIKFVHHLSDFAVDYTAMLSPDHPKWNNYPPSIRKSLRTLALFDVMQIRYLMLAVARHFSEKEAARAFSLFVNWIVRFFIAGAEKIGRVDKAYARLAHSINEGKNIRTAEALADEMRPNLAPNDEFFSAFATARVSQAKLARYYLEAMERRSANEEDAGMVPDDDTSRVNLEHIVPLTPEANWPDIDPEIAPLIFNRIGNMVLLNARKNAKIGNIGFSEKRKVFADSPFALTKSVAQFSQWGPDQITERQLQLAEIAVKTWPLSVK